MGDSLSILCVIIFIVLNQNTAVKVMFLQVQIKEHLFLILNDFREVNSLKNKNKKELNDDMLKNLDKSTVEKKMKELEELIEEIKERELQKTTDENRKKAILNAYNKAINGLNEAKEKIENSME